MALLTTQGRTKKLSAIQAVILLRSGLFAINDGLRVRLTISIWHGLRRWRQVTISTRGTRETWLETPATTHETLGIPVAHRGKGLAPANSRLARR
jgi:hypothetical protein